MDQYTLEHAFEVVFFSPAKVYWSIEAAKLLSRFDELVVVKFVVPDIIDRPSQVLDTLGSLGDLRESVLGISWHVDRSSHLLQSLGMFLQLIEVVLCMFFNIDWTNNVLHTLNSLVQF